MSFDFLLMEQEKIPLCEYSETALELFLIFIADFPIQLCMISLKKWFDLKILFQCQNYYITMT